MKKEYILVIDSGIGGLSILAELCKVLPANYIYFADNKHCPYGSKTGAEITTFLTDIISFYCRKYTIKLVVLACNTATASAIESLRKTFKNIVFVGTEPAVKLATNLGFNKILAITTPATARQNKYKLLEKSVSTNVKTLSLPTFASNIEQFLCQNHILDALRTKSDIYFIKNQLKTFDCVVLGCTHYALIKDYLKNFIDIPLIDGSPQIAKQTASLAKTFNLKTASTPSVKFVFSGDFSGLTQIYKKIFRQILAK